MRRFFDLIRSRPAVILLLFSFLFFAEDSRAQITGSLLGWNFHGVNSPDSAPASFVDKKIVSSRFLTRGPGASSSPGTNSFLTNGFGNDGISTANTDYFQFSIAVDAADTLSISYVKIKCFSTIDSAFQNPNGVYSQLAYSLNGTDFTLVDTPTHYYGANNFGGMPDINLSGIPSLKNIVNGTTVTFRIYASGHTTNGRFGFITDFSFFPAIAVYGTVKTIKNTIRVISRTPVGDYFFSDCNTSVSGSVDFTSTGTFPPGNVYVAKINVSPFGGDTASVVIGSLSSSANSGTINFTIPGTIPRFFGYSSYRPPYIIRVESTLVPDASPGGSTEFNITKGTSCYTQISSFRTRQSGDWNDIATWEMSQSDISGGAWVPGTLIPDRLAYRITINAADSVTVTTPKEIHSVNVLGKLKVLNNDNNRGSITFYPNILKGSTDWFYPMIIQNSGALQIVSAAPFDSVIRRAPGFWQELMRIHGKIIIGDGSSVNGTGFYQFTTAPTNRIFYWNGGKLEWNTTSTNGLIPTRYFIHNDDAATLRIMQIGPGAFGGPGTTIINGKLEVNTPINVTGTVIIVPNGYP